MSKSKGFGDSIEKFTEATGIKTLVEKTTELLGIEDCGCSRRKEFWNDLIPYNQEELSQPLIPNEDDFNDGKYIFTKQSSITVDGKGIIYNINDQIFINKESQSYNIFKKFYELGVLKRVE